MRLPAQPLDFLVVQLDPYGEAIGPTETSADLKSGDGAKLPAIDIGRWLPAISVACSDPEAATLAELQAGDWLHVTGVTGDTITVRRTDTARTLQPGEYLFCSLSAYSWSFLLEKVEQLEFALATRFGGYDGVPQWGSDGAPGALKVVPTSPLAMKVKVQAGVAVIDSEIFMLSTDWTSGTITKPSSQNRIDLVQAKLGVEGMYDLPSIKAGSEGTPPSPPSPDSGALALGEILLTPATGYIGEGNITDKRVRI